MLGTFPVPAMVARAATGSPVRAVRPSTWKPMWNCPTAPWKLTAPEALAVNPKAPLTVEANVMALAMVAEPAVRVVLVFSVVITPELVCPDRRDRTLSLYFSTAIGRLDYVLGKIAAALMPLLLVTLAPVLLLYAGTYRLTSMLRACSRVFATSCASCMRSRWSMSGPNAFSMRLICLT